MPICLPSFAGTVAPASGGAFANEFSVTLDGADDACLLGDSSTTLFDFGTADFTLSIWFKPNASNNYKELWTAHNSGGWLMYLGSSNKFGFYGDNTGLNAAGTLTVDAWNHGTVIRTSTKLKLYLNGDKIKETTISSTATFNKHSGITVGMGKAGNNAAYSGEVDEASLWTSALSDGGVSVGSTAGGDIATIYNSGVPNDISTLNPIGWWRMGESDSGSGTTVTDVGAGVGGTNVDGALSNGASFVTDVPTSGGGAFTNQYSVSFDGSDDYCDCGNLTAINSIANCSYSFWYKQVNSGLSVFMGNIDNKVGAYHWSDGNAYFRIANRAHTIVGSPTLNQWHHVVVTFDGSVTTSKLYLDGVYKSIVTNESSTTNFQAGTRFYIGRGFATGYGSPLIDEFSIFTTTLSDGGGLSTGDTAGGDIASIYNSGVPNDISSLSPVNWWRMGDNDGGTGTTITDQGSGGNDGTLTNGPTFSTDVPT